MTELAAMQRSLARQTYVRSPEQSPKPKAAPVATDAPVADAPVARPEPSEPEPVTEVPAPVVAPPPATPAVVAPPTAPPPAAPTESPPITAASVKQDVKDTVLPDVPASAYDPGNAWDELKDAGSSLLSAFSGYASHPVEANKAAADVPVPPTPTPTPTDDETIRLLVAGPAPLTSPPAIDPDTSVEIKERGDRASAVKRWNLLPSPEEQQKTAEDYSGQKLTPAADFRQNYEADPTESPSHLLEPLDYARRGLWIASDWVGKHLPDPTRQGEKPTAVSAIGDYMQDWTGRLAANVLESMPASPIPGEERASDALSIPKLLSAGVRATVDTSVPATPSEAAEREVGENFYRGFTDGTLYNKGIANKGYELGIPGIDLYKQEDGGYNVEVPFEHEVGTEVPGWRTPYPMGIHVIDTAIPPELARRLAATADTDNKRWLYANLSTHFGREAMGMLLEFFADPLWLFGPAKEAETVYMGDKAIALSEALARAGKTAAQVMRTDNVLGLKRMAHVVMGSEEEKKVAAEFFDQALGHAQQEVAHYTNEAGQASTDAKVAARATQNARVAKARLTEIQRGLTLAQTGKGAEEGGHFAYHFPFGDETQYLSKLGAERVPRLLRSLTPSRLVTVYDAVKDSDWVRAVSRDELDKLVWENLANDAGRSEGLTGAQQVAWLYHHYGPGGGGNVSWLFMDTLANMFGTRHIRMLMAKKALDATPASRRLSLFGGTTDWERLKRVPEEQWIDYQMRVTQYMETAKALETKQMQDMGKAWAMALREHEYRQRVAPHELAYAKEKLAAIDHEVYVAESQGATGRIEQLRRSASDAMQHLRRAEEWSGKNYSVKNVWKELWDLREAGAGRLDPRFNPIVEKMQEIARRFATLDRPYEHTLQAVPGIMRFGKGDLDKANEVRLRIAELKTVRGDVDDYVQEGIQGLQLAANAWLQRQGGLEGLVHSLGYEKLAQALEHVAELKPGEAGFENAIRQTLLELVGGDKQAVDNVLMNAAIAMGETSGTDALRILADLVSMQTTAGPGGALVAGLRELLGDWRKEADALKGIARGKFDDETVLSALHHVLSGEVELKIARAKGAIGAEQWPAFVRWARSGGVMPIELETNPDLWRQAKQAWLQAQTLAHTASLAAEKKTGALSKRMASIVGRSEGPFTRTNLMQKRLSEALLGVSTEQEALGHIRIALDDLLDTRNPRTKAIADQLAVKMARDWKEHGAKALVTGHSARIEQAIASDVARQAQELRGAGVVVKRAANIFGIRAEKELEKVRPRFELPESKAPVHMEAWEAQMQKELHEVTKDLTPYEALRCSFAVLRDGPYIERYAKDLDVAHVPGFLDSEANRAKIEERYGQVVGQRYQNLEPRLVPVVERLNQIVEGYEALYVKHGFDFLKDPYERLRDWGIDAYVPHILDRRAKVRRGDNAAVRREMGDFGKMDSGISTIDKRFGINIDAQEYRALRGTIAEINARANGKDVVFSLDPDLIVARYMQSNRAIAAKEFLVGMIDFGVAKSFKDAADGTPASMLAARAGYVPLFVSTKGPDGKLVEHEYARWMESVPELARARAIEDLKTSTGINPQVRKEEYRATLGPTVTDGQLWDRVAKDMNVQGGPAGTRVTGEYLRAYYEAENPLGSLYIPRQVFESMKNVFDIGDNKFFHTWGVEGFRRLQNWWKTHLTVTNVAFSTRNRATDFIHEILDLGVFGALHPFTQWHANQLAAAAEYAQEYGGGSLRKAYEALQTPIEQTRGPVIHGYREAKRVASLGSFKAQGLHHLVEDGIDLGDGFIHDCDEAIRLLNDRGVISPSFTQFVDAAGYGEAFGEDWLHGTWKNTLTHAASFGEDGFLLSAPMMMAGRAIFPVAVPKGWGAWLARRTENQGRLINFTANMKRGGNIAESVAHVNKFKHAYHDLTQVQKTWMRLVIPWFTWTQKNIVLQLDMLQRSPAFYNKFRQLFISGGPRLTQSFGPRGALGVDPDLRGPDKDYWPEDPGDEKRLAAAADYARSEIRMKLPFLGEGVYLSGLGTPIEAMTRVMGEATQLFNFEKWRGLERGAPQLRFLGELSFIPLEVVELLTQHSFFYGKDIGEIRNAEATGEALKAVNHLPFGIGPLMSRYLADLLDYTESDVPTHGEFKTEKTGSPRIQYFLRKSPYGANFNNAMALTEHYHLDQASNVLGLLDDPSTEGVEFNEIPWYFRGLDAISGAGVKQDNEQLDDLMQERRVNEDVHREMREKGITRERKDEVLR